MQIIILGLETLFPSDQMQLNRSLGMLFQEELELKEMLLKVHLFQFLLEY
jgi:hypothetical protein